MKHVVKSLTILASVMLVLATVISAEPLGSDGDLPFLPVLDGKISATRTAATDGFAFGTKASTEVIRDLWVGSDFDGDGYKEVLLASYGTTGSGRAYVYEITADNTAELFFDTGDLAGGYPHSTRHVSYGDLDGNGEQELIVSVNATGANGGIYVFEYDAVGDSMKAPIHLFGDLATANRWYVEGFFVEDVDGDGVQELMVGNNGSINDYDEFLIYSVTSGTFAAGDYVWAEEFKHERTDTTFPLGGSPYGAVTADMDGDGNKEVLFAAWDHGAMLIVEVDAADTYTVHNYIQTDLTLVDDFAFYDFAPADLDGDGRDEVYLSMYSGGALYCITCPSGTELSAMTTANVHTLAAAGGSGGVCTQLGDWDLDGNMEIIASGGGSTLTVHEYQGGDPTVAANWVAGTGLTATGFSGVYGMRFAGDLDGDGSPEIYGANTGEVTDAVVGIEHELPPAVFFSEYIEGSSNNKALEIYNGTGAAIDLAEYAVWRISNDGTWVEGQTNEFALSGMLEDGDVYVIGNASAVDDILFVSDVTGTPTYFNGDDPVALVYNGNIIDVIGAPYIASSADDPGTAWDAAGVTGATGEHTMVRKATVTTGNVDWAASAGTTTEDSEWEVYDQDTFDYLGIHPGVLPNQPMGAAPLSDTVIEVVFKDSLETIDVADFTFLGTAGVTFATAVIDTDSTSILLTATAAIPGDAVMDTVVDAVSGVELTLYAGITPISAVNSINPDGTIENGITALFVGVVSANDAYSDVFVSDAAGEYNGAKIYNNDFDALVAVGDSIMFTAERLVYYEQTELVNPNLIATLATGVTPFGPSTIPGWTIDATWEADDPDAEPWEGQLVEILGARVIEKGNYYYYMTDDGGEYTFRVGDDIDYHLLNIPMEVGREYDIIGVVNFSYDQYRINPRSITDVTDTEGINAGIEGTVTSVADGSPVAGVTVSVEDIVERTATTDASGYYLLSNLAAGAYEVNFMADGFRDAWFGVTVAYGDTAEQNLVMMTEDSTLKAVYKTSFEAGQDSGVNFFSDGPDYFMVYEKVIGDINFTGVEDTIFANEGNAFLALTNPDSGIYDHDQFAYWFPTDPITTTDKPYGYVSINMDIWYGTEYDWDFTYVGAMLADGSFYYSEAYTGHSAGWESVVVDISWILDLGVTEFYPCVVFFSDSYVKEGFGVAVDDMTVIYDNNFLAPVGNLAASNYSADMTLTWDEPASHGTATYALKKIDLKNPYKEETAEGENPLDTRRGELRSIEELTVEHPYENVSREFLNYKVYREDVPFDNDGPELLGTATGGSYTDASAVTGSYYTYFVTSHYEQGESPVEEVEAYVGTVTQLLPGATDFEGLTGGLPTGWLSFNNNPYDINWVTGDSTAAEGSFAWGSGAEIPASAHTDFAYVEYGHGYMETFEAILLSPFYDATDMYSAFVTFAGYAQVYSGYSEVLLLARVDLGEWEVVYDFSEDHYDGWVDYTTDIGGMVAGQEYVQFAFYYFHYGPALSGYGNGAAVDDFELYNLAGPTGLTATGVAGAIDLSWSEATRAAAQLNNVVDGAAEENEIENMEVISNRGAACYDQALGWAYYYSGWDDSTSGPASIFSFPEGEMTLDEAFFYIYMPSSSAFFGTEGKIAYMVGVADINGTNIDTISSGEITGTMDNSTTGWWVDLTGLTYMSTDTTFLKVSMRPLTSDGAGEFLPYILGDGNAIIDFAWNSGYDDSAGVFHPTYTNYSLGICGTPQPPKSTYNVYRDGEPIATGVDALTFTDEDVTAFVDYEYFVTGYVPLYARSDDEGSWFLVDTDSSNHAVGQALNNPPSAPGLIIPADSTTITFMTVADLSGSSTFMWSAASDPDTGQDLTYTFELILGSTTWTIDVEDEMVSVSNAEIEAAIDAEQATQLTGTWNVVASDGMVETAASNGPRAITFVAYDVGIGDEAEVPDVFALHQNYPNPFNPVTTIAYDIPKATDVRIDIYNLLGQRVRTLVHKHHEPAYYRVNWNGTTDAGTAVASGMYIYRIEAGEFSAVRKLVMMK